MNSFFAKYFFYYPVTLANGERITKYSKIMERDQWGSRDQLNHAQSQKLSSILHFAKENSPYYKNLLLNIDIETEFHKIPFLTKQQLIKNFSSICTHKSKGATLKTTGGSTGEPVKIFKNADALARERAATWRSYRWAGIEIGHKQARFWGVPHSKDGALKAKIIDFISNRKRLSAFNLTEDSLNEYYADLRKFRPMYLYGYVSVIKKFCEHLKKHSLEPISSIQSVITTSEMLTESDRKFIENTTGVKVYNEYGCGEVGSIAHECEFGRMHIVADNMLVEIIDADGKPAKTGEVVVTDFFNCATPMIRYRLGDFATLSQEPCLCGRTLPILEGIHGRAYDIIKTRNGKSVHPEALIYIFEGLQQKHEAFSQFQIIQHNLDLLEILVIPTSEWFDSIKNIIVNQVHAKIDSSMKLEFTLCDKIQREKSGKMRVVKSNLSQ